MANVIVVQVFIVVCRKMSFAKKNKRPNRSTYKSSFLRSPHILKKVYRGRRKPPIKKRAWILKNGICLTFNSYEHQS
jgi:hypothetical protein